MVVALIDILNILSLLVRNVLNSLNKQNIVDSGKVNVLMECRSLHLLNNENKGNSYVCVQSGSFLFKPYSCLLPY